MKFGICLGVFLLLGYVWTQENDLDRHQRREERRKSREEEKILRQQRRETHLNNTFKWTVMLNDTAKTELRQGAYVNTDNEFILFWSDGKPMESAGFNKTIMIQDNSGLVAVFPLPRGHIDRKMRKHSRRGRPSPLRRTKRQSSDDVDPSIEIEAEMDPRPPGRGRHCRDQSDDGRRPRHGCRNHVRRGNGRGPVHRDEDRLRSARAGRPSAFLERGGPAGGMGRRLEFMRGAGSEEMPCYIVDPKYTYADTVNMVKDNKVQGTVDVAEESLDFVTDSSPMAGDVKSAFVADHPYLATFCGERDIIDARTLSTGDDLNIKKVVNVIGIGGRFKIRIKANIS